MCNCNLSFSEHIQAFRTLSFLDGLLVLCNLRSWLRNGRTFTHWNRLKCIITVVISTLWALRYSTLCLFFNVLISCHSVLLPLLRLQAKSNSAHTLWHAQFVEVIVFIVGLIRFAFKGIHFWLGLRTLLNLKFLLLLLGNQRLVLFCFYGAWTTSLWKTYAVCFTVSSGQNSIWNWLFRHLLVFSALIKLIQLDRNVLFAFWAAWRLPSGTTSCCYSQGFIDEFPVLFKLFSLSTQFCLLVVFKTHHFFYEEFKNFVFVFWLKFMNLLNPIKLNCITRLCCQLWSKVLLHILQLQNLFSLLNHYFLLSLDKFVFARKLLVKSFILDIESFSDKMIGCKRSFSSIILCNHTGFLDVCGFSWKNFLFWIGHYWCNIRLIKNLLQCAFGFLNKLYSSVIKLYFSGFFEEVFLFLLDKFGLFLILN